MLAENPEKAAQYAAGKKGLMGFFVGQVLKRSGETRGGRDEGWTIFEFRKPRKLTAVRGTGAGGKANPKAVSAIITERLALA